MSRVTHSSNEPAGLAQLDSVLSQLREACRSAEQWQIDVNEHEDGAVTVVAIYGTEIFPPVFAVAEAATAEGDEAEDGTDVVLADGATDAT